MIDIGLIVAAVTFALVFRWFLFRVVYAATSWRKTGKFIGAPVVVDEPVVVAEKPYDADHVVHAVGSWEHYKMRLGIGLGPRALCGYHLYTVGDGDPRQELPENAPSCPDCDQVWLGKHPAAQAG